jgi:CRP-like cAMP-binding protein|tara:strand:+ start:2630 stop:3139 length:510 start_codon:yes stop_codon:yes gene_type:complete
MDIKQLKSFSVFQNITDEEAKYFFDITEEVRISEGNIFIKEGEVGDSIYMLVDGKVEVSQALTLNLDRQGKDHREKALTKFSGDQLPPPLFGEMSLFNENDLRTANVKALTDCHLLKIMKDDFLRICDTYPDTGYKVMLALCRVLCIRLVNANNNVLKLTTAFSLVLER